MKSVKLSLVIAALTLFALACGGGANTNTANTGGTTGPTPPPSATPAASATPADALAEAKDYYMDNCATCHMEDGQGGTVKIDNKRLKVPSLSKGHALTHTDEEFAKQIANGGDGMPGFKDKLSEQQINDLVRLIRRDYQSGTASNKTPLPGASPIH